MHRISKTILFLVIFFKVSIPEEFFDDF